MSNIGIVTLQVAGFKPALKGMRNPMASWDKMDSVISNNDGLLLIGYNDMQLAQKLIKAGAEHRKFMRMIQLWADVEMPRYWWQEADTYKFGVKNSTSTMHKIWARPVSIHDFYRGEIMTSNSFQDLSQIVDRLNELRNYYMTTRDFKYVREMKRLLPESYIQLRTWNTNYEEVRNMYHQRKHHMLKEEWVDVFCGWVETLPYAKQLIMLDN